MEYLKDTPNEQQDEKKAFDEDDKRRAVPFEIGKILAQKIREKQGEISVSMKADPEYKDTGSKFHPKVQRTFKKFENFSFLLSKISFFFKNFKISKELVCF